MKDLVKMKVMLRIAIAVLSLVIGFSMIACEDPNGPQDPPGGNGGNSGNDGNNGNGGNSGNGENNGNGGNGNDGNPVTGGNEPSEPLIPPPSYNGAAGAVTIISDAVVDSDPSVVGLGVEISAAGVVSMKKGSVLHYKFPTSLASGAAIDIERDYDYIDIEYTVSNVVKTSGGQGNFKARFFQYNSNSTVDEGYISTNDIYGYIESNKFEGNYGGGWADLKGEGTHTDDDAYRIQTWGAGGKGGFTIWFNWFDITSTGCDSLDVKITKITFTKGVRYTVKFSTPKTPTLDNVADIVVLYGNCFGSSMPSLTYPNWTFLGWYNEWDVTGQNGTGTRYNAATPITQNSILYARWHNAVLPTVVTKNAPANDTLFSAVGDFAGATPYTYDGKDYWIIADSRAYGVSVYAWTDLKAPFNAASGAGFDAIEAIKAKHLASGSIGGYTRIAYDLTTLSEYWDTFDKVRITYDMIEIGGSYDSALRGAIIRNSQTAGGGSDAFGFGNTYPDFEPGTGKTMTGNVSALNSGGLSIVKNNPGAFLLRITKIELFNE